MTLRFSQGRGRTRGRLLSSRSGKSWSIPARRTTETSTKATSSERETSDTLTGIEPFTKRIRLSRKTESLSAPLPLLNVYEDSVLPVIAAGQVQQWDGFAKQQTVSFSNRRTEFCTAIAMFLD